MENGRHVGFLARRGSARGSTKTAVEIPSSKRTVSVLMGLGASVHTMVDTILARLARRLYKARRIRIDGGSATTRPIIATMASGDNPIVNELCVRIGGATKFAVDQKQTMHRDSRVLNVKERYDETVLKSPERKQMASFCMSLDFSSVLRDFQFPKSRVVDTTNHAQIRMAAHRLETPVTDLGNETAEGSGNNEWSEDKYDAFSMHLFHMHATDTYAGGFWERPIAFVH
ncbi:hypothetical protein B0J11DRAFT_512810 [Dendryphion nanum]|uniref:Uncharacterized protein n=1 Tax=Dendryphion nanum TaxID=256645 RepID=A0A9P9CZ42_9PLEO|nr:hypothetical protein B0J11DRAFT_512810 [Dendryphion nanum]